MVIIEHEDPTPGHWAKTAFNNATSRPSVWPPFQAYPALWRMSNRSGRKYYPVRVMSPPDRGQVRCWVDDVVFKWIPLGEILGAE